MFNFIRTLFGFDPKTETDQTPTFAQEMLQLSKEARAREHQDCLDKEQYKRNRIKFYRSSPKTHAEIHLLKQLVKQHAANGKNHLNLPNELLQNALGKIVGTNPIELIDQDERQYAAAAIIEELESTSNGFQIDYFEIPQGCYCIIRWLHRKPVPKFDHYDNW